MAYIRTKHIRDGVVTTAKIEDDAITSAKIADDAVTTAKIVDGAVTAGKLIAGIRDRRAYAVLSVPDVGAGGTDAALTAQLYRMDSGVAVSRAVQLLIVATLAQYTPDPAPDANVTFSAATAGSIVSSGNGWALVQTDATGAFACTVTNGVDETVYFRALTADAVSDIQYRCVVAGTVPDAATWSA